MRILTLDNQHYDLNQLPEEVDEFVDNLPTSVIKDFELFFDTMPKMYHKLEYKNKKGTDRVIELKTLEDFFTFR